MAFAIRGRKMQSWTAKEKRLFTAISRTQQTEARIDDGKPAGKSVSAVRRPDERDGRIGRFGKPVGEFA